MSHSLTTIALQELTIDPRKKEAVAERPWLSSDLLFDVLTLDWCVYHLVHLIVSELQCSSVTESTLTNIAVSRRGVYRGIAIDCHERFVAVSLSEVVVQKLSNVFVLHDVFLGEKARNALLLASKLIIFLTFGLTALEVVVRRLPSDLWGLRPWPRAERDLAFSHP